MGLTETQEWTLTYLHIHNQICINFVVFFLKQIRKGLKPQIPQSQYPCVCDSDAYVATHPGLCLKPDCSLPSTDSVGIPSWRSGPGHSD